MTTQNQTVIPMREWNNAEIPALENTLYLLNERLNKAVDIGHIGLISQMENYIQTLQHIIDQKYLIQNATSTRQSRNPQGR